MARAALAACSTVPVVSAGCSGREARGTAEDTATQRLILATTTSTQDTGLLDVLVPAFEAAYPAYRVEVIAVGTGEALAMGERGDADVLLVHAKADEERFVQEGFGDARWDVMYNDFIIVGPASDPARVKDAANVSAAVQAIARSEAPFISRGDDSGTHKKELDLWREAGLTPSGTWYVVSGQGMGETLTMASEEQAYTLSDRGTFLAMRDRLDLVIVREGDAGLVNQYGVIPVTRARNREGATAFARWITGTEAQRLIASFGTGRYGEPLFKPNANE